MIRIVDLYAGAGGESTGGAYGTAKLAIELRQEG